MVACGLVIVPSTALLKVMGRPTIRSRLPLRAAPLPWLSLLMSAVSVVLVLILMVLGLALCVRTMKGSKQIAPATTGQVVAAPPLFVIGGVFEPHQLFVTSIWPVLPEAA